MNRAPAALPAAVPAAPAPADAATVGGRAVLTDPVIWLLLALGLALRLLVGALLPAERGFVSDEQEYYAAARVLADGRGLGYHEAAPWLRPPGYLLVLATTFRLLGESPEPARWLQMGLSLLLGPLAAWLGWLASGRRLVARLAAGLTLLLLPLAVMPWLLLTETLFTLLLLLGCGGLVARQRGGGRGWLALAGLALGGACLMRGAALGFVGLAALGWLAWGAGDRRRRLIDAALLLGLVAATIAPWTARNALAYRALIPLETTGAYNLWLRAQGNRGESWMLSELLELPDPASRQAHAARRGLALAAADPLAYLARGWREVGDVWRLNFGAPERFMSGFSGGEVSRPWLLLSLVLDDLLYLALLPLAVVGLARAGPGRWLTLTWLGWTGLTALLFFAIVRFRLPALPLLAVQAALGLVALRALGGALARGDRRAWLTAGLAGALLAVAALSFDAHAYRVGWLARPRWEAAMAAEALRRAGDPAGALAILGAAEPPLPSEMLTRAVALAELGRVAEAEATIGPPGEDARRLAALGEVRRLAGDPAAAASLWSGRIVDLANPVAWAWGRVNRPGPRVEVGDGLDLGLARGVYPDEQDGPRRFRWTDGHADILARAERAGPATLRVAVRGYRPPGAAPAPLMLLIDGRVVARHTLSGAWEEVTVPVTLAAPEAVVTLVSPTLVGGYADPRALGVMLDWVALEAGTAPP